MKTISRLWIYSLILIGFVSILTISCKKDENNNNNNTNTVTDIDGNVYHTITIGTQVWIVENLSTTKYNNGDPINNVTDATSWGELKTGAWCNYDNDFTTGNKYGKLYNWYAVKTGNLAPIGWHVPSYAEWEELAIYVSSNPGISGSAAKSLAATIDWDYSSNYGAIGNDLAKNNSTGFTALPCGGRSWAGGFDYIYANSYWWSSTELDSYDAKIMNLYYDSDQLMEDYGDKANGLSVRCLKDYTHSLPSVVTSEVIEIGAFNAIMGGTVTNNGGEEITGCGVCWSKSIDPTLDDSIKIIGSGTGDFSNLIHNLNAGTTYYVKAFATNRIGTAYGNEVSFTTIEIPVEVTDIDGNIYHTITLGTQTWMVENLKTTKYRNGDPIPNITDAIEWGNLYTGAYCDYDNLPNNSIINGRLYNWYAVDDSRGIAPTGWHVPSHAEWDKLETYLIINGYNYDGSITENKIAKSLASTSGWYSSSEPGTVGYNQESNNSSGFTGFPGGYCWYDGSFGGAGYGSFWWTSTEWDGSSAKLASGEAYQRYLLYDYLYFGFVREQDYKVDGFSVRCLWDY